jgi:hypothetical protein
MATGSPGTNQERALSGAIAEAATQPGEKSVVEHEIVIRQKRREQPHQLLHGELEGSHREYLTAAQIQSNRV